MEIIQWEKEQEVRDWQEVGGLEPGTLFASDKHGKGGANHLFIKTKMKDNDNDCITINVKTGNAAFFNHEEMVRVLESIVYYRTCPTQEVVERHLK